MWNKYTKRSGSGIIKSMEIINKYCSECLKFNGICWLKWDMPAGMGYAVWNGLWQEVR